MMCEPTTPRPSPSHNSLALSIGEEDAQRILEASRQLNERLARLRSERDDAASVEHPRHEKRSDDEIVPKRVVSSSDHGSVSSFEEDSEGTRYHHRLVEAASTCGNPLIESFLHRLQASETPDHEVETCLLLFLDTDKSAKLRAAFRILSLAMSSKPKADIEEDPTGKEPKLLLEGAVSLFKCFLTSISTCIRDKHSARDLDSISIKEGAEEPPRKVKKETEQSSPNATSVHENDEDAHLDLPRASPSFDSSMAESKDDSKESDGISDDTRKEIEEIANFASERLAEHVQIQSQHKYAAISYEAFGDWYNSGGYSVVAWIELLDLAKWKPSGKSEPPQEVSHEEASLLAPIKEESMDDQSSSDSTPRKKSGDPSPLNFFMMNDKDPMDASSSRTLVSFDFTGAMSSLDGKRKSQSPFCINITEENLLMLRNLVHRTGLASRSPHDVCNMLLRYSSKQDIEGRSVPVLPRHEFARCIRELVPAEASRNFSKTEMEHFSTYFTNFFSCFDNGWDALGTGQVNVKELAVGFSFLCAGNKSAKLTIGFELIDEEHSGHFTQRQLTQYVRSYLTMLVGISLLSSSPGETKVLSEEMHKNMMSAVDTGARWTLGHFLKYYANNRDIDTNAITFENFATWYTNGGYNVAPWLELLDLSKLLALLGSEEGVVIDRSAKPTKDPVAQKSHEHSVAMSPRRRRDNDIPKPSADVLFTFPLSNRRSLVVLREDATYVRSVVEKLGLLSMSPEELWSSLFNSVKSRPTPPLHPWNRTRQHAGGTGKSMDVDQPTFVRCMEGIMESTTSGRKRPAASNGKVPASARETLVNFFQSFDIDQLDRVALNQLMGGLSLLCGGKKSTKLAFAFGLFDGRDNGTKDKSKTPNHSLNGEELFVFLRSFLIVLFSCCRQSMDLSAEAVGRYISDTAHMVADDVTTYQWHTRKRDRVDFDEFGEWYNEGGFETAPWLELLDLRKWVLVENFEDVEHHRAPPVPSFQDTHRGLSTKTSSIGAPSDLDYCPPPPPEDEVDASFFGDDDNPLMPMDSIDEMDIMLMQQPSQDKENDGYNPSRASNSMPNSPNPRPLQTSRPRQNSSLKFHLVTHDDHGGYMLSVSQRRVSHLRQVLIESGLYQIDSEEASKIIMSRALPSDSKKHSRSKDKNNLVLSKDDFDSAIRSIIASGQGKPRMSVHTQQVLSELLACIFEAFDRSKTGRPDAVEVACGFMVLCHGKKSDKLEYAFEVLDTNRDGKLSRREMSNYLNSFLTVLLSIASVPCLESDPNEDNITFMNGARCDRSASSISRIGEAGSGWAAGQAFKSCFTSKSDSNIISFDDFAEWYTSVGYSSIPWLELLDLRKWVLSS